MYLHASYFRITITVSVIILLITAICNGYCYSMIITTMITVVMIARIKSSSDTVIVIEYVIHNYTETSLIHKQL